MHQLDPIQIVGEVISDVSLCPQRHHGTLFGRSHSERLAMSILVVFVDDPRENRCID
jgi:hypothetical protein